MKKTELYIFTLAAISLVCLLVGWGSLRYYYVNAREALWIQKMQSGQREIRELGVLLEHQLKDGISPDNVIRNMQQSILNTDVQSEFVCMYNTDGIELCHPNPSLIGTRIETGNSTFLTSDTAQRFQKVLQNGKLASGVRIFPENTKRSSEIVSVQPVKYTNWMLASHANIVVFQDQLDHLYQKFLIGALFVVLVMSVGCFCVIRAIYRKYEVHTDLQIEGLNEQINTLSILNRQLELKQHNTLQRVESSNEETLRKRILTYQKDEIIAIDIDDIAYISLVGETVSTHTFQRQVYPINNSLDELMKQLNNDLFYRANRQFIININSIESILVYGKNQLQLKTTPKCSEVITISKNRVSEFKKWLDR